MSRSEFADEINETLARLYPERQKGIAAHFVNDRWVGALERGERRWTSEERRAALRAVTGSADDFEIGLYPPRDRITTGTIADADLVRGLDRPDSTDRLALTTPGSNIREHLTDLTDRHEGRMRTSTSGGPQHQTDGDLVEFTLILEDPGIGPAELTAVELACERLDQGFAAVRPDDALVRCRLLMGFALAQLRRPQKLCDQERLVALAARLAGLRAWACFDLNDHREAEHWYQAAATASEDARAWGLGAWLMGAQSLVPWHRRDFRRTLELIDRGSYLAGQGSDVTTQAWLYALRARACAGLGDLNGFRAAYGQALEAAEYSNERDRRHGMDFDRGTLDLRYYAGMSWLLLRRPAEACLELNSSLDALPRSHNKARSVLTLALSDAAVQSDDVDQAVDLARAALTASTHQPIMPILQQGRRIRRLVQQRRPEAAQSLDEPLRDFALALTSAGTSAGS
ncbi:hypothetical protein [Paractinoplanes durhamensis]|nr:hypothetical protein [Actinoplanes durhamensis]